MPSGAVWQYKMYGEEALLFSKSAALMGCVSPKYFFEESFHIFIKENMELMAVTCRQICLRRNKVVFDKVVTHHTEIVKEAISSLEEFRRCNSIEGQESSGGNSIS
jgi:hypothetical protein